jgi:hypothetical protein
MSDPLVIAHAGHWLVSVAYLAPLVFLVGIIVHGKLRDRRTRSGDPPE